MIRSIGLAVGSALLASTFAAPAHAATLTGTPDAQQTSGCALAERAFNKVLDLANSTSDEAILASVDKIVAVLPVDRTDAQNYVDTNGNRVLELIRQDVSGRQIASALGIC